eukprot:comp15257_c0_seq1/m.12031 comp15257_c0_seq1/g.12031  ORF comp15257_c0_seq1/g.12031 comp15257_c0_seq1/m.12031 type:complete len:409 (+) comp15257_c0_seq1:660-1886(+)
MVPPIHHPHGLPCVCEEQLRDDPPQISERNWGAEQQAQGGHQVHLLHRSSVPLLPLVTLPQILVPCLVVCHEISRVVGCIDEEPRLNLPGTVPPVVPRLRHSMVPKDHQDRVWGERRNHLGNEVICLLELVGHEGAVGAKRVATVVDPQQVANQNVPVPLFQLREDVCAHAIVDGVQVTHIERVIGVAACKGAGEQPGPRVVPHVHHLPAACRHVAHPAVLCDGCGGKVAAGIDEGGQAARGQPLDALHGCGRRICYELVHLRKLMALSLLQQSVDSGQAVCEVCCRAQGCVCLGRLIEDQKVVSQRIHHEQHGTLVGPGHPATCFVAACLSGGQWRQFEGGGVRAMRVQHPACQQKPAQEQIQAQPLQRTQPQQQAKHMPQPAAHLLEPHDRRHLRPAPGTSVCRWS